MQKQPSLVYEFGPYRLEPAEHRLTKRGQALALRPKLFDLLTLLVEGHGHLLGRDELLQALWPDVTVEESNITVSINALRHLLGDADYIETVMGHGYRFTAPVRIIATEASLAVPTSGIALPDVEQPGGALAVDSPFYVVRDTDADFHAALRRRDSVVLVKGSRQIGKTSLLARGLEQARHAGAAVVLTDYQQLTAADLTAAETLLRTLAEQLAEQLELAVLPRTSWTEFVSPSVCFDRYLRHHVFPAFDRPLVWAMDEVDRLFNFNYASEIFGLFRSWHNRRALEPAKPWRRLTLTLAYATEAHLFITDLNQSPFNVGTRLALADFTRVQVGELNQRHGAPLRNEQELADFHTLLGGHPYLTQGGLYELARCRLTTAEWLAQAGQDEGIFGNHLRRLLAALAHDEELTGALCSVLRGAPNLSTAQFYRLRSAGVIVGATPDEAQPRCELYRRYLRRQFA